MESTILYTIDLVGADELNRLFKRYYAALAYFACAMVKDSQEAEGIATEAIMQFWHQKANFADEPNMKAFLYISVRNACLNFLKSAQSRRITNSVENVSHEDIADVAGAIVRIEVLRQISVLLQSLPGECRKVMELKYVEGLKDAEVAERLQISIHTVKNQATKGTYLLNRKLNGKA